MINKLHLFSLYITHSCIQNSDQSDAEILSFTIPLSMHIAQTFLTTATLPHCLGQNVSTSAGSISPHSVIYACRFFYRKMTFNIPSVPLLFLIGMVTLNPTRGGLTFPMPDILTPFLKVWIMLGSPPPFAPQARAYAAKQHNTSTTSNLA